MLTRMFKKKNFWGSVRDPRVAEAQARRRNERIQRKYQGLRRSGNINLEWYHSLPSPHAYKGRVHRGRGMSRFVNWRVPPRRVPNSEASLRGHPGLTRQIITKDKHQAFTADSPHLKSAQSSKRRRFRERRPDDPMMRSLPRSWRRKLNFAKLKQMKMEAEYRRHIRAEAHALHQGWGGRLEKTVRSPPTLEEMKAKVNTIYRPQRPKPMLGGAGYL